jgi:hypothetical protein
VRHKILAILAHLDGMTGSAILGRHHDMDFVAIMLKGILMLVGVHGMTLGTTDNDTGQSVRDCLEGNPPLS